MSTRPSLIAWRAVGDVVDLRGVEHGEPGFGADHPGEVEVRCRAHAVDRDHLAEHGVVDDVAADDVDEVDQLLARCSRRRISRPTGVSMPSSRRSSTAMRMPTM